MIASAGRIRTTVAWWQPWQTFHRQCHCSSAIVSPQSSAVASCPLIITFNNRVILRKVTHEINAVDHTPVHFEFLLCFTTGHLLFKYRYRLVMQLYRIKQWLSTRYIARLHYEYDVFVVLWWNTAPGRSIFWCRNWKIFTVSSVAFMNEISPSQADCLAWFVIICKVRWPWS